MCVTSLAFIAEEEWLFADDVSRVRYLLTALENGIDGETLGASLYELTLIPDFKLFADPGMVNSKIRRNLGSVRNLMASHKSVRGRIADLGLSDKALEASLSTYFEKYDIQEPESWTAPIAYGQKLVGYLVRQVDLPGRTLPRQGFADGLGNRFAGRSGE
jgi:DNA phosphorothioation-dependent restriction protein DptH